METEDTSRPTDFIQAAAAFGRARAKTARALRAFEKQRLAFVANHGDRASLADIAAIVPSLSDRLDRLDGEKVTGPVVARAYRLVKDIAEGMLTPSITSDIAQEAEEALESKDDAARLRQRHAELERANQSLLTACETLGDAFDEGEETMANPVDNAAPKPRRLGGFRTPRAMEAQVKADTVASQLINTLDRLGLPHVGGSLSPDDDSGGQLLRQLVRALDDQFETVDTATGRRAQPRQRPLFSRSAAGYGGLSGRLKIDAQAIDLDAMRLGEILDGIEGQLRFQDRDPAAGFTAQTRRLVDSRIDAIRTMAASPQGIPARQVKLKTTQLWQATLSYLNAIGIGTSPDAEGEDREDGFGCGTITVPQGVTSREELISEVNEVSAVVGQMQARLFRSAQVRSNAEIGYRLQNGLIRAAGSTRATLGIINSVAMTSTLNVWDSVTIAVQDSTGDCQNEATLESLGNGMIDALTWLLGIADRFVDDAQTVGTMTSLELEGLSAELGEISLMLGACHDVLADQELEEPAATVADQVSGLALVTAHCAQFAHTLAR
jgi:hypothetical protein